MSGRIDRADDPLDTSLPAIWCVLGLLAAVGIAYFPAFGAGFVWDDDLHLLNNSVLLEDGLYRVWVLRSEWIYWPVTFTSYWAEFQIWGLNPTGYHAVNVAIHAVSALMFWRVLLQLRLAGPVAILAALLFAIHPQNVESVAWIAQRKNNLSMLFFLLAIHGYLRFDAWGDRPPPPRHRWLWHGWAFLAFALGMLSKGSIAPLPLALVLALAWRRGFGEPGITANERDRAEEPWRRPIQRRDLVAIAVFLIPAALFPIHDILREQVFLSGDVVRDDSLAAKLAGAGWNTWFYAWKSLVPWPLSFVYPRWQIDGASLLSWIPTSAALLGLAATALLWRRGGAWAPTGRALSFVAAYYALMIFPSVGFVKYYYLRYSLVADHYQYYAHLGLAVLFATGLGRIARIGQRPFWVTSGAVLLVLGILTYRMCLSYQDEETLWRATLATNPEASLALNGLGGILASRGEYDEALPLLLRSVAVDPTNREAWMNVGIIQDIQGEPESALESFRKCIRHWPGGESLPERGIDGLSLSEAHVEIGLRRTSINEIDGAGYHYRRAAQLDSGNARAKVGIGNTLLLRGAVGEAVSSYREALDLEPDAAEPLERLTRIYASFPSAQFRDASQAVDLGEHAARVTQRRDARVLDALAAAYAEAGRFEEAVDVAARAVELASRSGETGLAEEIESRLDKYRRREPHRMESLRLRPVGGAG